ncbi:rhodopsin [Biomphalaria pfeifferi]|uniref:Rhodopsin n=1 Tax=Biomphalaria pfeifferi TaxID=112525 RepID=A0AAD8F7H3_BIOPF|nr:rhodopsin [Biomphalaria pfeifferi]
MDESRNTTVAKEVLISRELLLARDINQYYLFAVLAMGLPGNLLIVVTCQSIQPLSLSSLLVSVVAMFDTLAIVVKLTDNQLLLHRVNLDAFLCKTIAVFSKFFSTIAVWMLVMLCVQQCLSVYLPTKKSYFLSKSRSCILMTVISFAIFAALLVLYFVDTYSRFNVIHTCADENSMTYESLLVIESLHVIIPHMVITVLVFFLHCGLGHFSRNYCSIFMQQEKDAASASNEVHTDVENRVLKNRDDEITLVNLTRAAASMFLILSLGTCGYVILTILDHFEVMTLQRNPKWYLFAQISNLLLDSTFCLKFLLYFLSSGTFRKYFVSRFVCHG